MDLVDLTINAWRIARLWRTVLFIFVSGGIAVLLTIFLHWLSIPQGFLFALLGFIPANEAEENAIAEANGVARPLPPPTTSSVVVLSAIVAGGVWGTASGETLHATLVGACVLAAVSAAWFFFHQKVFPRLSQSIAFVCIALAAIAFGAGLILWRVWGPV